MRKNNVGRKGQNRKVKVVQMQLAGQLNDSVFNSIEKGIYSNSINVSEEQTELKTDNEPKKGVKEPEQTEKFHQILEKKKQLETELAKISQKEKDLMKSRQSPMQSGQKGKTRYFRSGKTRYFRSEITEEEKEEIKHIIKERKKFQNNAAEKTQNLLSSIERLEEEQKKEKQRDRLEKQKLKRRTIQRNLQQIEKRKLERAKSLNFFNKKFQEVSKRTFLHETIDNKWKVIAEQKQEERKNIFLKNRQSMKFDFDEIKKHERKYSQIVNQHKDERQVHVQKFKEKLTEYKRGSIYPRTTFFNIVSEEDERRKALQNEKMKQSQFFSLKKDDYSRAIKEKNAKRKSVSKAEQIVNPETKPRKSKDYFEIYKEGHNNMKQIHSCISEVAIEKSRMEGPSQPPQRFKYRDYLKEMSSKKRQLSPEQSVKKKFFNQKDSEEKKLMKARILLEKMEARQMKSNKDIINCISTKLAIIEQFGGVS